jgi:F420-0:gamma-glutamyl ligase
VPMGTSMPNVPNVVGKGVDQDARYMVMDAHNVEDSLASSTTMLMGTGIRNVPNTVARRVDQVVGDMVVDANNVALERAITVWNMAKGFPTHFP